jgi:hypothetical protein
MQNIKAFEHGMGGNLRPLFKEGSLNNSIVLTWKHMDGSGFLIFLKPGGIFLKYVENKYPFLRAQREGDTRGVVSTMFEKQVPFSKWLKANNIQMFAIITINISQEPIFHKEHKLPWTGQEMHAQLTINKSIGKHMMTTRPRLQ